MPLVPFLLVCRPWSSLFTVQVWGARSIYCCIQVRHSVFQLFVVQYIGSSSIEPFSTHSALMYLSMYFPPDRTYGDLLLHSDISRSGRSVGCYGNSLECRKWWNCWTGSVSFYPPLISLSACSLRYISLYTYVWCNNFVYSGVKVSPKP